MFGPGIYGIMPPAYPLIPLAMTRINLNYELFVKYLWRIYEFFTSAILSFFRNGDGGFPS